MIFAGLLWISVAVLLWRMVVSKQQWPVRLGAAAAAMLTFVGSITATGGNNFEIQGSREWVALALCAAGPTYLFLWSLKHRGRKKSKTISLIAAVIGFVPILAALIITYIYAE